MFRPVLSIALAGTIALTSLGATATPAQADNKDAARVILGATALFLLLNESNKGSKKKVYYKQGLRKVVPHKCRSVVRTHRKPTRVFSRACLKHNMNKKSFRHLPNVCKNSIRTAHGWRTVFTAKCLRRHGWRTS